LTSIRGQEDGDHGSSEMDSFSQVGSLRDRLSVERLDQLICDLNGLGAWRPVAASVLNLAADDENSADWPSAMGDIIALDPGMTAGLLSLANRGPGKISRSVGDAVEKLPPDVVRAEMLSGHGFVVSASDRDGETQFDHEAFNRHCLAVAVAAGKLSAFGAFPLDPQQAFVCGLLHDVGKLALVGIAPKSYQRAIRAAEHQHANISDNEREIIGVDHSVAGLHLARQRRLGPAIEAVAWLSHQPIEAIPDSIADRTMVEIVALADTIARECGIGFSGNFKFVRSSAELASRMGLACDIPQRIAEGLNAEVCELLAPLGSVSPRQDIAAYHRAVAGANAKLGELNRSLRNAAGGMRADSDVLGELRRFASCISPEANLPETLAATASAIAGALSIEPSDAEPIIAYCLQLDSEEVLLTVLSDRGRQVVKTCRANPQFDAGSYNLGGRSAAEDMVDILADINDLRQWIDPGIYEHYRLVCDGSCVGGLLAPCGSAGVRGPVEKLDAMCEILSLTLAMARGQSRAARLSEQLAGAGQVLAAAQETLTEARSLAAMGEMAAGAGHELNNPLAVISGRAQLMRDRATNPEERKTWTQIADQAHRISDIITDLMDFASPPRAKPEIADVAAITGEIEKEFAESQDPVVRECELVVVPPVESLKIFADIAQIRSAIGEVVSNAAIAANAGGDGTVRVSCEVGQSGDRVLISVSDKGPGMDARTLSNAFTPFFSAQAAGRRVGLGLSRARRYVVNNGGGIWIQSRPGEGTTVYVELPRAD